MTENLLLAVAFYVGGGLACYLFGCYVGLSIMSVPTGLAARTGARTMTLVGFAHPVAALVGQDLARFRVERAAPTPSGSDADQAAGGGLRLDAALVTSLAVMAAVTFSIWRAW